MLIKKTKGKPFNDEQTGKNQEISRFRVLVEHVICRVKRCCIVKDLLLCHKLGFDDMVMELAY